MRNQRKIEKDEESVKPRIINDEMIRTYIKDYNKDNKIFDKNDMPIWELEHLSLSYKSKSPVTNMLCQISLRSVTWTDWRRSSSCNWTTTSSARSKDFKA